MAETLYEHFETGLVPADSVGRYWICETFTPSVSHTAKELAATFPYSIRAASGGAPTGADLGRVNFPETDAPPKARRK